MFHDLNISEVSININMEVNMGKHELSPGVKYLQSIGFSPARGEHGLPRRLYEVFGQKKGDEIFEQASQFDSGSIEFYEFMNSDPKISRSFIEAFDCDIIKESCNFIANNIEYFGDSILEVGCNCGYITGFLASLFPNAKIVAIDRCVNAIRNAEARMAEMGVENVSFLNCTLDEVQEKFDTIVSMRTLQENINSDDAPFYGEALLFQIAGYQELTKRYTESLLNCLKDDGALVTFERVSNDPLLCGWWFQLHDQECGIIKETKKTYLCAEGKGKSEFQAFVAKRGIESNYQELLELWYKAINVNVDGKNQLTGWNALVYLKENAGKLVRGVYIIGDKNEIIGRFAIIKDKDENNLVYYLSAPGGQKVEVSGFDSSLIEDLKKRLQETIDVNIADGRTYREINAEEDVVEGNLCNMVEASR